MDWNAAVAWQKLEDVYNVERQEHFNETKPIEQLCALDEDQILFFHEAFYEEQHEHVEAVSKNPNQLHGWFSRCM